MNHDQKHLEGDHMEETTETFYDLKMIKYKIHK